MAKVKSLDIKISASEDDANAKIKTLVDKIERIARSLFGANSGEISKVYSGINKLADVMDDFADNTKAADFTKFSSGFASGLLGLPTPYSGFEPIPENIQEMWSLEKIGKLFDSSDEIFNAAKNMGEKLIEGLEGSFSYKEVSDYFDTLFGQLGNNLDYGDFLKWGYRSANTYYNSFSGRAVELFSRMTGININYQAMFGQISNASEIASEIAHRISDALSKIDIDLGSIFSVGNIGKTLWDFLKTDLEEAMKKMGGFGRILTDDLSTIMKNDNTMGKVGAIGSGIAGAIGAGITGWQMGDALGTWIDEQTNGIYGRALAKMAGYEEVFVESWRDKLTPFEESIITLNEKMGDYLITLQETKTARDLAFENGDEDVNYIKVLADKYLELAGQEELTNEQLTLMEGYKRALIEANPEFEGILSENYESYGELKTAVDDYIGTLERQAKTEAAYNAMKEISAQMLEVEKQLKNYTPEMIASIESETARRNELGSMLNEESKKRDELERQLKNCTIKQEEYEKQTEESRQRTKEIGKEYVEAGDKLSAMAESYIDLTNQQKSLNEEMEFYSGYVAGNVTTSNEIIKDSNQSTAESAGESAAGIVESSDAVSDSMDGMGTASAEAADEVEGSTSRMELMVKTLLGNLLEKFGITKKSMGEISDDLPKAKENASTTIGQIIQLFQDGFSSTKFEGYGKNILEGTINGLKNVNLLQTVQNTVTTFAGGIKKWFTKPMEINSPSKLFESFGAYTVEGFNIGLLENMQSTEYYMKKWADGIGGYSIEPDIPVVSNFEYSKQNIADFAAGSAAGIGIDISMQIEEAAFRGMRKAIEMGGTQVDVKFEPNELGIFRVTQRGAANYVAQTGLSPFPV